MGARCTEDVRSHHERKVFAPAAAKRSSFTQANLLALRKKYADVNLKSGETASSAAELQNSQSNSSGFVGVCSGHTFLNTLCDDTDLFQTFVSWCQYLHKKFAVRTEGFCACSCQTLFVHSSILFSAEKIRCM